LKLLYIHHLQKSFADRCKIIERENRTHGNQESKEAREEGRQEKEVAAPPTKGNTSGERIQRSPDVFLREGLK